MNTVPKTIPMCGECAATIVNADATTAVACHLPKFIEKHSGVWAVADLSCAPRQTAPCAALKT